MMKQILIILFLSSSFAFSQYLQVIFDANTSKQNDSTYINQFLSITTDLLSSLEYENLIITHKRINEEALSIKEKFNLLDSLYADLYISISCDIKNDSKFNGLLESNKRIETLLKRTSNISTLDSLFQREFFRLSDKSIPDSAKIFYPITSTEKSKRLTHMVIDLKPIMNTLEDRGKNEKVIQNIVDALRTCIMHYVSQLQ